METRIVENRFASSCRIRRKRVSTTAGVSGACVRYNRQLHPQEKALAKELANSSGGKYSEQQIEQQLAQMNLTTGNQTELGSVRVAVGNQPVDGTTWTPYGDNQVGQQLWAQSLPSGDADLQSYITKNASGLAYECRIWCIRRSQLRD
jgi:hypothetical protein